MPSYAEKLLAQGVELHRAGRIPDAEPLLRKAAALEPTNVDALSTLARFLTLTGRGAEALDLLTRARTLAPANPWLLLDLSNAARAAGRVDDAVDHLRHATRDHPTFFEARNALAALHVMLSRDADAEAEIAASLRLRPNHPDPLVNLGTLRLRRGRLEEAIAAYHQALAANPNAPMTWSNLATAYQETGLAAEAIDAFQHALQLDPGNPTLWDNYLLAINRAPDLDPAQVLDAHRQYGLRFAEPHARLRRPHPNPGDPGRRLKVGYVSFDFRRHSVAYFIEPVLRHHDRAAVHVTCYSSVLAPDDVTARLRTLADDWQDVAPLSDFDLAERVRRDQIDLLIDLSGHTLGNRLQAFGLAPAPVQISFLGYPNTTGLSTIQYRVTDPLADPPGLTDPFHTERLLRLPTTAWCYQPPPDAPPVLPSPASPLTFGSFNHFSKVTDPTVALWSAVLRALPDSRLLLKTGALADDRTRRLAADRFARHGVSPDRLRFLPFDPSPTSHLATYHQVDVALDTFPYHGTTTTCEALHMGVPVLTLAGQTHASRVGVSLLTAVGLPDLVASTSDQFAAIATSLATDLPRLATLRATLRDRLLASPLCDAPAYARALERAYRTAWQSWCAAGSHTSTPNPNA